MKIQDQHTRPTDLSVTGARTARTGASRPDAPRGAAPAAHGQAGPAADVAISSRSRELHGALAKANSAPDVRADKVAEVRRRLETGTYVIDPTRIARGILNADG